MKPDLHEDEKTILHVAVDQEVQGEDENRKEKKRVPEKMNSSFQTASAT